MKSDEREVKVLVVDDEAAILNIFRQIFTHFFPSFSVEYCLDGSQAIEKLEKMPFSIIFTDMIMPRANGDLVVEKARKKYGDLVKIVMMSGYGADEIRENMAVKGSNGETFGINCFLQKPAEIKEIKIITENLSR